MDLPSGSGSNDLANPPGPSPVPTIIDDGPGRSTVEFDSSEPPGPSPVSTTVVGDGPVRLTVAFDPPEPPGPSSVSTTPGDGPVRSTVAAGAPVQQQQPRQPQQLSRYESQKRRDWNTFLQYLTNHKPPLTLSRCSGAHVIEFLKYLDQFGKTKVHVTGCPYFGQPNPPAACGCQLKQAWGSLDALIGRLRAAYEENGGKPELNPFGARAVRMYLREVRESQAKARGIPYEKKRKRPAGGSAVVKVSVDGGGGGDGGEPPAASSTN